MAKSMIGLDPLAWLSPDSGSVTKKKKSNKKAASKKKSSAKKKVVARKKLATKKKVTAKENVAIKKKTAVKAKAVVKKPVEKYVSPLGLDVETLESSFSLLEPQAEQLVEKFYQALFEEYPDVIPMFANTTPQSQQKKLLASLKLVVANLRKPDVLGDALKNLGSKHQGYGAEPAHYTAVASTLIGVMKELAGDAWTEKIQSAWEQALNTIAEVMLGAYKDVVEIAVAETKSEESTVSDSIVTLSDVQDISMVADLHKQVAALINTQDIVFDGSAVERIDASSLQLIACAFKQAETYDNKVSWQGVSDALKQSASLLGLNETLNL